MSTLPRWWKNRLMLDEYKDLPVRPGTRTITAYGVTMSIPSWAAVTGCSPTSFFPKRIARGLSDHDIVTLPPGFLPQGGASTYGRFDKYFAQRLAERAERGAP